MTIIERKQELERLGWQYNPDSQTWSGGTWSHETFGFVHKGGGSFDTIAEAVERLEVFLGNLETITGQSHEKESR